MRRGLALLVGLVALVVGVLALAGVAATEQTEVAGPQQARAAALAPITGQLDRPGYTVIAVAADGRAAATLAPSGRFSVVPTAVTVSLQLRAPDGTYAGPIVLALPVGMVRHARAAVTQANKKVKRAKAAVARAQKQLRQAHGTPAERKGMKRLRQAKAQLKKAQALLKKAKVQLRDAQRLAAQAPSWAAVGVKAGAPLGAIRIDPAAGYARAGALSDRVWRAWVKTGWTVQAKNRVPVGNGGNDGLVRSSLLNGAFMGDLDRDGVPDVLDIDVNGNLVLNNLERSGSTPAHSPRAAAAQSSGVLGLTPGLPLSINDTANADAAGLTPADSDAALVTAGSLEVGSSLAGELDCGGSADPSNPNRWIGGLRYCTRGGTGTLFAPPAPLGGGPKFPECCDQNNNGFGSLQAGGVRIQEGTAEIKTGDLLIEHVTQNGSTTDYPATLQYVFATVPALRSYSDTAGDAATVHYPVADPIPTPADGGPGTTGNPFPVAAGPSGDAILTLTLWRPQRRRTKGDPGGGQWMDIGGLTYLFSPFGGSPHMCPQSSYSTTDPNLTLPPPGVPGPEMNGQPGGALTDKAPDRPADPANTLTFTVNLTQCFASRGVALTPGETISATLTARASNTIAAGGATLGVRDYALQGLSFKLR